MIYDNRPPRGGWAPGGHYRKCLKCLNTYLGSQSSLRCADCAYAMQPYVQPESTQRIKQLEDRIKRLEEVGDEMLNWLTDDGISMENLRLIANAWRKAKESKP